MEKTKRVNGKVYKQMPGAPALWFSESDKRIGGVPKRYSTMELKAKQKRK